MTIKHVYNNDNFSNSILKILEKIYILSKYPLKILVDLVSIELNTMNQEHNETETKVL